MSWLRAVFPIILENIGQDTKAYVYFKEVVNPELSGAIQHCGDTHTHTILRSSHLLLTRDYRHHLNVTV